MTDLLVCAALGIEERALKTDGVRLERVGMGTERAKAYARRMPDYEVLAVAGFGGAADNALRAGDVVVADEVRRGELVIECPWADSVAASLQRHLILEHEDADGPHVPARSDPQVVTGPIATVDHLACPQTLTRLAGEGVTTVDMESFPLVATADGRPFVVVRVIVDTPEHPLLRPATLRAGLTARKRLRAIGAVLRDWAAALEHV
ncbi:MAG: hypothetical protein HOV87_13175 [Catenulispora sp.]|nr:hypothetical protein [Catenulispora sp.]